MRTQEPIQKSRKYKFTQHLNHLMWRWYFSRFRKRFHHGIFHFLFRPVGWIHLSTTHTTHIFSTQNDPNWVPVVRTCIGFKIFSSENGSPIFHYGQCILIISISDTHTESPMILRHHHSPLSFPKTVLLLNWWISSFVSKTFCPLYSSIEFSKIYASRDCVSSNQQLEKIWIGTKSSVWLSKGT